MTTFDWTLLLSPPDAPTTELRQPGVLWADSPNSREGEKPPQTRNHDDEILDAVVISDLHLGSDNCLAKEAAAFLQSILDGEILTRCLVVNGDVFDSIDFRRLKKSHWKVLSQIRHLSDKIEVVWIVGNHDGSAEIVSHLLGVRVEEEYVLKSATHDILIIHGHQYDDFIIDHPVLTWMADLAYWLLQKIDHTHHIARLAKKKSKSFVRCIDKIQAGARRLAGQRHCTVVICGHTHLAQHLAATDDVPVAYYNCGCWTERPSTFLSISHGAIQTHVYLGAESLANAL